MGLTKIVHAIHSNSSLTNCQVEGLESLDLGPLTLAPPHSNSDLQMVRMVQMGRVQPTEA